MLIKRKGSSVIGADRCQRFIRLRFFSQLTVFEAGIGGSGEAGDLSRSLRHK